MNVTVFGVSHRIQGAAARAANIDDLSYAVLIRQFLKRMDFVFEEASGLGPTFAETTAVEMMGSGKYRDVDPSREERPKCGIAEDTARWEPIEPGISCDMITYEFDHEHEKREEFWLTRIREHDFTEALFICGYLHVLSMAFRLRGAGYRVEACHYMPFDKLAGTS